MHRQQQQVAHHPLRCLAVLKAAHCLPSQLQCTGARETAPMSLRACGDWLCGAHQQRRSAGLCWCGRAQLSCSAVHPEFADCACIDTGHCLPACLLLLRAPGAPDSVGWMGCSSLTPHMTHTSARTQNPACPGPPRLSPATRRSRRRTTRHSPTPNTAWSPSSWPLSPSRSADEKKASSVSVP